VSEKERCNEIDDRCGLMKSGLIGILDLDGHWFIITVNRVT